ncbi:MAG: adenosylcobinamide amidohydrolase [Veillonellaceae bacterium]|jgi:adenosylcobinamide hydrolase|nr:adenosylcobinamide amidohydrolase [Veillonellaceae bacterium]
MENQFLKSGGALKVDDQFIICTFPSPRLVLSTSLYNGGYLMADAVFNHRLSMFVNSEHDLPGGSMENYLEIMAKERGLNGERSTGLLTSARMNCRAYSISTFNDLIVEVVATAGVDKNAARAGDAGCYFENNGNYQPIGGTINILAFTNIKMPYGSMAKALLSITEAKTAALQELAIASPLTQKPATGTGTDGVILVCNQDSPLICRDTGTQSKLGELFCTAVKTAVKQSLALECDISSASQGALPQRLCRSDLFTSLTPEQIAASKNSKILLAASQSIWQEYCWGLLDASDVCHFIQMMKAESNQPCGTMIAAELQRKISNTARSR